MRYTRTRARVVSNYVEQSRHDVYSAKSLGGHSWVLGAAVTVGLWGLKYLKFSESG